MTRQPSLVTRGGLCYALRLKQTGGQNGTVHKGIAGEAGRPDLQGRVDDLYTDIGSRVDAIDKEFAERHGFPHRPRLAEEGTVFESQDPGPLDEGLQPTRDLEASLDLGRGGRGDDQDGAGTLFNQGPGHSDSGARSVGRPVLADPEGRALIACAVAGI